MLAGAYQDYNAPDKGILAWLDSAYQVDTIMYEGDDIKGIGDLIVTPDNELRGIVIKDPTILKKYYYSFINRDNGVYYSKYLMKDETDAPGDRVVAVYNPVSDNIIISWTSTIDVIPEEYAKVRSLDLQGNTQWLLEEYPLSLGGHTTKNMIITPSGNIILCGAAYVYNDSVMYDDYAPMTWSVNKEGELLWLRFYNVIDEERIRNGALRMAARAESGDLFFAGSSIPISGSHMNIASPILIKTDSLGCLEAGCDLHSYITNLKRFTDAEEVTLSPNPAMDYLRWQGEELEQYFIFDSSGRVKASGDNQYPNQLIDISGLLPGMYVFWGRDKEARAYIGKFVKIGS